MAIKTSQAINGFISADPRLTFSESGQARFYARVGINHYEPQQDGSVRKLDPTYHDLIQFGKSAEMSADRYVKGDDIVAQGYTREYTRDVNGEERTDEQFVAKRIAPDPNITDFTIDRRPAAERQAEREADRDVTREAEREEPDRAAQLGSPTPTTTREAEAPAMDAVAR